MIDGHFVFDQPLRNDIRIYDNIRKVATDPGDEQTSGCLLDYAHIEEYLKLIAIDLSEQQALDVDPNLQKTLKVLAMQ